MFKKICVLSVMMLMVLWASIAMAQDVLPPDPNADMGGTLTFLVSAFQGGNWFAVGAIIVMLVVWIIGKYVKIDTSWMPVISAAVGMISSLALEFIKPETVWYEALYQGLLVSGPASLFWGLFGKKVLPTKR